MADQSRQIPDYYKTLGVSRAANESEIRKAFRSKARETHPDVNKDPKAEEAFKQFSEAFEVLTKKRTEYDNQLRASETSTQRAEGASGIRTNPPFVTEDDWETLFERWFGRESFFTSSPLKKKDITEIYLPENDVGLIATLVKAYSSDMDGEWRVKPAETDKRQWMPDELYSVVKRKGEVLVFRRITDWRNKWERNNPIKMKNEKERWRDDPEAIKPPNYWFGEYYLAEKGWNLFSSGLSPVHHRYAEYLGAIKSYAKKLAEGNDDYREELETISKFAEHEARNTRVEGKSLFSTMEDHEWVRRYEVGEIPEFLRQVEGRIIQIEGNTANKEGGGQQGLTRNVDSSSGETLG